MHTRSAEAVVSALQQARACFPFPILGVDTDNGYEFINECLLAYCDVEQITFTRGREGITNDQNFVEQKNGAVVRQVVGYARFEGEHAYRQLGEVYQALRLYVNGFQPSMKLQAKQYDGKKMRRIYDAAKTPLQRLVLSQVLPASKEQELQRVAQVLDPLRLFHHLQDLQQALLDVTTSASLRGKGAASGTILPFCIERCLGTSGPLSSQTEEEELQKHLFHVFVPDPAPSPQPEHGANGRAHSLHQEEAGPSLVAPCHHSEEKGRLRPHPIVGEKEVASPPPTTNDGTPQDTSILTQEPFQPSHDSVDHQLSHSPSFTRTLAQAIQNYLEDQKRHHRRPKTLEWHEHALGLFQRYLFTEHQCILLNQITEEQVRGWISTLPLMPTANGTLRSPNTVESYIRSARAFCQWLVHHHYLPATPFADLLLY